MNQPVSPLAALQACLTEKFPDYANLLTEFPPRESDRKLLSAGHLSEVELLNLYSQFFGVPLAEEEELGDPELFPGLSIDALNAHLFYPCNWDEESVCILVSDPYELDNQSYLIAQSMGLQCRFQLVRRSFLERLLSKASGSGEEDSTINAGLEDENTLRTMAGEARIVRLVNDMFNRAIDLGASDIHVEPGEISVSIRCRVDGVLTEIINVPRSQFPAIASRIKLISGLNIAESRLPQDGRTNIQLGKMKLDMRVSTIPILTGESIVLRLLNSESITFDLKSLGMDDAMLEQFHQLIQIPYGIILVVGPTGSGKTTTLYSVIAQLNDQKKKIITVEDPVEYKTPGLCQMQVNHKIGVTFASGLRSIVRQDPDIILVGEIRDRETADIAINAALTGHLVLSTLHTNDAVGAVTRLIDMGMEGFLVSSALYGVLSQRLVRKICPVCNGSGKDDEGGKCRRCNGTGYKGRCGIFELLRMDDEIRRAVNTNASSSELEKIAVKNGMIPLREDGMAKVRAGITTLEELSRSTTEA
ncbi:MAG: type II/IV secretion system protein [Lentisphaeria bacterium]|nr:type II/IV secretion system protein [Lentisphaeria bacterium]